MTEGCDCTELCSMGPTCPGGMLARLPGSGCDRARQPEVVATLEQLIGALDVDLFGDPVPVPIDPVGGDPHNVHLKPNRRRRTDIVADRIAVGRHPLTNGPLHPEASRDRTKDSPPAPFTCGACVHRGTVGHHTRSYPKCVIPVPGVPDEFQSDLPPGRARAAAYNAWWAVRFPRVSRSDASDVRAWWPACPAYQERPTQP